MIETFSKIDKFIETMSGRLLVGCIFTMLTLSMSAIALRWIDITFTWFEPFIRHLVFLGTFLGGVIATGRGTHISIDIIGKILEGNGKENWNRKLLCIISLVTFLVIVWLVVISINFMLMELKYGKPVFFDIHSGFLVGIIPFGFVLIAYRFFFKFILVVFNHNKCKVEH